MPYASNTDLNADVKKAHPSAHAQTVFRAAFNAALAKYGSEAQAFAVAHAAANKQDHMKAHPMMEKK